ncbi:hypothetical protein BJF83_20715 [Nocardiopsis sp. CNR-923]|uniref:hypothetical protein n=1 Tax=Nocardiopsis sp. CNR-923 TaxID=1904965 RepID=UPI00095ED962|nr:hypothetical protein [Nocardiopsis sp. CNR-923]OLT26588.1 hypothetical protein BJF83_20715 [Nocardiopsis sp. CNR-923]
MSRSQTLRRLAAALAAEHPGCHAQATYDAAERDWTLSWIDGPTTASVRERLPADGRAHLRRHHGRRALAVCAVALSLAGRLEGIGRYDRWALEDTLREHLDQIADPQAAGGRTGALADALLADLPERVEAADIVVAVIDRGLARLLRQSSTDATSGGQDPLAMSPAEYLTSRYAEPGRSFLDWSARLTTAPPTALVAAALDDERLDADGHLAVVALLGQMRAEQERLEDRVLAGAHAAGASWARIGAAMGITKQSAHARASRRSTGRPTRASGQR